MGRGYPAWRMAQPREGGSPCGMAQPRAGGSPCGTLPVVSTRAAGGPATSSKGRLSPGARRGLAAAAGILPAPPFQPYTLWPLVVVGIALLTLLAPVSYTHLRAHET